MAEEWQSAWVEVLPDFSEFRKKANKQLTGILDDAGNEAGTVGSKRAGTAFVGGIGKWGVGIAGAFAALGLGRMIGDFFSESINLGSGLNESKNAIKVAYGSAFKDIAKLAKGSDIRLGLSELDFNSIATQFSAFALAIEGNDPAKFLDKLATRGADFASVFNIGVADALGLFQSGLAGESEPLRKYGIDLSAASVAAFAYGNGIAAAGEDLTETQKQQARFGLLMAQTDKVQGDFLNTSDQFANSQRIFQATLDDTKAKLGESLLPALTGVVNYGNEQFLPMLDGLVSKITDDVIPTFSAFAAAPEAVQNAMLEDFWADLGGKFANGWDQIVAYMTPRLENGGHQLITGFSTALSNGWTQISTWFLAGVAEWGGKLRNGMDQITGWWAQSVANWGGALRNGWNQIVGFFSGLSTEVGAWGATIAAQALRVGANIVNGLASGIRGAIGVVGKAIGDVMKHIADFFPHSPAKLGEFAGSGWNRVKESGAALAGQLTGGFNENVDLSMPGITPSVAVRRFDTSGLAPVAGAASERPIYADGTLVGWIRQLANGEASLVMNKYDQNRSQVQTREWAGD